MSSVKKMATCLSIAPKTIEKHLKDLGIRERVKRSRRFNRNLTRNKYAFITIPVVFIMDKSILYRY